MNCLLPVLIAIGQLQPAAQQTTTEDHPASIESVQDLANTPKQLPVCLLPLGVLDRGYVEPAVRIIQAMYGVGVVVLRHRDMPPKAWYQPRKRWRAEVILSFINEQVYPGSNCRVVVALTSEDISTSKGDKKDWGIFGLGQLPGTAAVVSTHRLKKKGNQRLTSIRVLKVVTHELGHTLGLPHCPTRQCNMNDAQGTVKTVDKEPGHLCESCKAILKSRHPDLTPPAEPPDWDKLL